MDAGHDFVNGAGDGGKLQRNGFGDFVIFAIHQADYLKSGHAVEILRGGITLLGRAAFVGASTFVA